MHAAAIGLSTHHNNCFRCSTARLHTWRSRSVRTSGPSPQSSEHPKEEAVPCDCPRSRRTRPGRCRHRSRDLGSRCCSSGRNGRRSCSSGNSSRADRDSGARRRRDMTRRRRRARRRLCSGRPRRRMLQWSMLVGGRTRSRKGSGRGELLGMRSWSRGRRIAFGRLLDHTMRVRCHTVGEDKLGSAMNGIRDGIGWLTHPASLPVIRWVVSRFRMVLALKGGAF